MTKQIGLFVTAFVLFVSSLVYAIPAHAEEYSNPYEWVGEAHNEGVLYVLEGMEETPESLDEFAVYAEEKLAEFLAEKNYPATPTGVRPEMLDELAATTAGYDGRTLEELQQNILELEQVAAMELEGDELAVFQASASIARHSAELWTPAEYGGLGGLTLINDEVPTQELSIGDIVDADWDGYWEGGIKTAVRASAHEAVDQVLDFIFGFFE